MFYNKLKLLCENKGVTMQAMEEACDFGSGITSKWKQGKGAPSLASLRKLASYFNCDIHELVDAALGEEEQQ